ncbi:hypothetical protein HNQ95_004626 [Aminobacter ciceronei]|uniref:Uncharacterized protein n=1 Tax=Aminobacter ciceronei TaxID=150723 RepID=A0ABR6CCR8_9HYPH|nr:hypothetical protein [Aminobacter ciceronei]MBA9022689.1 hypothetical protein [Aminobacter ciceronei]
MADRLKCERAAGFPNGPCVTGMAGPDGGDMQIRKPTAGKRRSSSNGKLSRFLLGLRWCRLLADAHAPPFRIFDLEDIGSADEIAELAEAEIAGIEVGGDALRTISDVPSASDTY